MTDTENWPRYYRRHKEVHAVRIRAIEVTESVLQYRILPEDDSQSSFVVSREFVEKHNPYPGGYIVAYADGYLSFSPEEPFLEGYTRI